MSQNQYQVSDLYSLPLATDEKENATFASY